jgi:uncharacterized membrane protein HdeD (DUF308 family)
MAYVVLGAWLIQSAVGVALLVEWLRHRRRRAPRVFSHVALGLIALALWLVFLFQESLLAAWLAFALISVGNGIGDSMLVRRWRRMSGSESGFWTDYGRTIGAVFRGAMPRPVTFHALFAGVVYFLCLGVCIGASVS